MHEPRPRNGGVAVQVAAAPGTTTVLTKSLAASRGMLDAVTLLPTGCYQEGAGDCIWDPVRGHFWAGFGPRSTREAADFIGTHFGREVVALELATAQSYHLDVCFCPLSGGEILYYPPAFTEAALRELRSRVPASVRIEAT